MPSAKKTVSVIIPTYNGAHRISGVLRTLLNQSVKPYEVIVVVDGSTDETLSILMSDEFKSLNLKIVSQKNHGRGQVRNVGAEMATGRYLIFFDDDIRAQSDTIEKHIVFLDQNPSSIICGPGLTDPALIGNNQFLRYRSHIEKKALKEFSSKPEQINGSKFAFTSQNLGIPRAVFSDLNGFDRRLTDNEDLDLCLRAFLANIPVFFNRENWVWHDDNSSIEKYIQRQCQYINSKRHLLRIHPGYRSLFPSLFRYGETDNNLKKTFYLLFSAEKIGRFFIQTAAHVNYPISILRLIFNITIYGSVLERVRRL